MSSWLNEMVEHYRAMKKTRDLSSVEQRFLEEKLRQLWWEIRQEIKSLPKAEQMRVYRGAHPEKVREQISLQSIKQSILKDEVLSHYSDGKCVCVRCGFSDISALSIDHIEGGGNRQRKGKLRTSTSFYNWLKKEGYPLGYQTLCMNCQFLKRFENGEHN